MEKTIQTILKYAIDNNICEDFRLNSYNASYCQVTTKQKLENMVIRGQIAYVAMEDRCEIVWRMIAEKTIAGCRAVMHQDYPLDVFTTPENIAIVFENFPAIAQSSFMRLEH